MFWLAVQEIGVAIRTAIWKEVQITKLRDLKERFELPETAICGKFLGFGFGLRDFKSLAICDLWLEHLDNTPAS